MRQPIFQLSLRRGLFAVFWLAACLGAVRAWRQYDEVLYFIYAGMAFCILLGTLFRRSALAAFVGFLLVMAALIVANIVAFIQLL